MEPLPHKNVPSVHCTANTSAETSKSTSEQSKRTKNNVTATVGKQTYEEQLLVHYRTDGAMSVHGQLYETKLLTLFLLRLLSNKVEFYLGANISGIGALDDLCFKYKPANSDKYVVVFLQAKHKVKPDKNKLNMSDLLSYDSDFSVQKHFESYLMIRQRFTPKSREILFKDSYHDSQCFFVVYTPLKHNFKTGRIPLEQDETNNNVKDLIKTNITGDILQLEYKHVEFLKKQLVEKNVRDVGKAFSEFIMLNASNSMMDDKLIRRYQVVLAQCVVDLNRETAEGIRYKFRSQFFDSTERLTTIFRETLYDEIVNNKAYNTTDGDIPSLVSKLDKDISAESLSSIIGNVVTYDQETNKLVLIDDNFKEHKNFGILKSVRVDPSVIRNAINIRGKSLLQTRGFLFPKEFVNKDITLTCKVDSIDSRLDFLTKSLLALFKIAKYSDGINLVDVYESMVGHGRLVARGVMEHDGGLGSALGNLLVVDEDTGALKFNVSSPLPEHANTLWNKLKQNHDENLLTTYRFQFHVECFPKLSFEDDLYEESLVKDFIGQYWLCTGQAKENAVERKSEEEILKHLKDQKGKISVLCDKYHTVFLILHDIIQKWWMLDKALCLNKDTTFLQDAMSEVVNDLLLAILHRIYVNKLKSTAVEFAEVAVKCLGVDETVHNLVMIVTNSVTLTAVKLMQHYNHSNNCYFIDFNCVTNLMYFDLLHEVTNSETVGNTELQKKALVITCRATGDMESVCETLAQFVQEVPNKKILVITDEELSAALKQELACTYHEVRDDKNGFINLCPSSQEKILSKCKIIYQYQGEELILK